MKLHLQASPLEYPDGRLSDDKRAICTPAYGLAHFSDLFTSRQLTMLTAFSDLVDDAAKRAEEDALRRGLPDGGAPLSEGGSGAKGYGEAIAVYLAILIDKLADYHSTICTWHSSGEKKCEAHSRGRQFR